MDYGVLTDNAGKKADFRNVILIMTSNAGARELEKRVIGFDENARRHDAIDKAVEKAFSPEFRNRLDEIVPFNHINEEMALLIAEKAMAQLAGRLKDKSMSVEPTDEVLKYIARKGLSREYGAREIMRIVNKEIKKLLADALLFAEKAEGGGVICIGIKDGKIAVETGGPPDG
jgi:ATP-dependent Clp protease ATP-binding subunit ClpA